MSNVSDILENSNELLFTAEFPEIDSGGMETIARHAARIAPWFDAANSTDNTAAHAHASNTAVAIAMKMHGLEPIMQIVCRDKNRLASEADLMGAALHGIENVAMLTGDDVSAGDEPEARKVFDLDGPQAIAVAKVLSTGQYLSGRKINPAPRFYISAVENPAAPPLDYRIERALKKQQEEQARWEAQKAEEERTASARQQQIDEERRQNGLAPIERTQEPQQPVQLESSGEL